jgi:hypothetical protein
VSVYGDMLGFFPELFERFLTYQMLPKTVAGFEEKTNERTVRGIFQFIKASDVEFEGDTTAEAIYPTFWTRAELPQDSYILDSYGNLFRRVRENSWKRIGAFSVYRLEAVIGVDGRQVPDPDVDGGIAQYA